VRRPLIQIRWGICAFQVVATSVCGSPRWFSVASLPLQNLSRVAPVRVFNGLLLAFASGSTVAGFSVRLRRIPSRQNQVAPEPRGPQAAPAHKACRGVQNPV